MRKPSDIFQVDQTNDLLAQVPGLGFAAPGKQRMTGGDGGKIDTRMQVEDTNKAVEAISGLKSLNESGPKSTSHVAIHEAYGLQENSMEDAAVDLIGDTGTKRAVERLIKALEGFKEMADGDANEPGDEDMSDPKAAKDIENDIKVLKGVLGHFKHVR